MPLEELEPIQVKTNKKRHKNKDFLNSVALNPNKRLCLGNSSVSDFFAPKKLTLFETLKVKKHKTLDLSFKLSNNQEGIKYQKPYSHELESLASFDSFEKLTSN